MKILLVEPAGKGGICQHAHNLANALAARNHEVTLATAVGFETKEFPRSYQAIEVFDRFRPHPLRILRFLLWIRAFRPDVVHIEAAVHPGGYFLIWKAVRAMVKCRFVYTAHDVVSKKSHSYHPWMLKQIYRGMDHIIVNAIRNKEEIVGQFGATPNRVAFVPVGDLVAFVRDVPPGKLEGVPPGTGKILFFGNIEPRKGLMTLIRAFSGIVKEVPAAFLIIMGRPYEDVTPYQLEIQHLGLSDRVFFRPGYVPLDQISTILTAADVVVLPYEKAWNSGIILSAYSYGKPVVATSVSGLSEAIEDGKTGFIVPPGDTGALQTAISRILSDSSLREQMQKEARKVAEMNSWARIAEETERIYTE
ncbi:MAG: glycosyltransferase family 4 protein [bacterium]